MKTTTTPSKKKFKVRTNPQLISAEKVVKNGEPIEEDVNNKIIQETHTPSYKTHSLENTKKRLASAEHNLKSRESVPN